MLALGWAFFSYPSIVITISVVADETFSAHVVIVVVVILIVVISNIISSTYN